MVRPSGFEPPTFCSGGIAIKPIWLILQPSLQHINYFSAGLSAKLLGKLLGRFRRVDFACISARLDRINPFRWARAKPVAASSGFSFVRFFNEQKVSLTSVSQYWGSLRWRNEIRELLPYFRKQLKRPACTAIGRPR
ncbi:hypothetical protein SBA3_2910046 [Candidatus Sulfopaludibacter sp. SbA3]|nr:hypothetical protein SBA3_2910046 [Candidatus Sulfopaludibacter sp. SbA3]